MSRRERRFTAARAFTITELVVTVAALTLLVLPVIPTGGPFQRAALQPTCATKLAQIGQGVAACFAENNGYGPTWDDGAALQQYGAGTGCMLTWLDLLYDLGYVPEPHTLLCPVDQRPDEVAQLRGAAWDFRFVDQFGVGEELRYGVRGSFALNAQMHHNFKQDKFFDDPSRQVYAMDGWWTWFGSLNAAWIFYEHVTGKPPPDPVYWPNWQGTMVGWRHGAARWANTLYLDGHAAPIKPLVPDTSAELVKRTVNTLLSFTWLPGEQNIRYDWDPYKGDLAEYLGRVPYWTHPDIGTFKTTIDGYVPKDFPDHLSCNWRTVERVWVHLPADPDDRY